MKDKYATLYKTSYGVIQGVFKKEMTFEEAEKAGEAYCLQNEFKYIGTFTEDQVGKAKADYLKSIR